MSEGKGRHIRSFSVYEFREGRYDIWLEGGSGDEIVRSFIRYRQVRCGLEQHTSCELLRELRFQGFLPIMT